MPFQRYSSDELHQVNAEQHDNIDVGFAAMDITPTRAAPGGARRTRRRQNRTPNLLANTSLDENLHALPPRPAGPILSRRQREAIQQMHQEMDNQEMEDMRLEQQLEVERQQVEREADLALRRSERHDEHAKHAADIMNAVDKAVQKWQKDSPSSVVKFMQHRHNACTITAQPVLVVDILLLFGESMPTDVRTSLEAAAKFYHVDAWLRQDLDRVEHSAYFPEEMVRAAKMTKMKKSSSGIEYVHHIGYGSEKDKEAIVNFENKYTSKGEEEQQYRYIEACFRIRKAWYEGIPEAKRIDDSELSPHMLVIVWCIPAMKAILTLAERHKTNFVELVHEMSGFVTALQQAERRDSEIRKRINGVVALFHEHCSLGRDNGLPTYTVFMGAVKDIVDGLNNDFGEDWKCHWRSYDEFYDMAYPNDRQSGTAPVGPTAPGPEVGR